ncbi:hypothetical protein MCEMAEM4_00060 [Burkholderiaceae bacterium]
MAKLSSIALNVFCVETLKLAQFIKLRQNCAT